MQQAFRYEKVPHTTGTDAIIFVRESPIGPVDMHIHDELELLYAAEGELHMQSGTQTYILNEGDMLFINPLVPHATVGGYGGRHIYAQFRPADMLGKYDEYRGKVISESVIRVGEASYDRLHDAYMRLISSYMAETNSAARTLAVHGALEMLCAVLADSLHWEAITAYSDELLPAYRACIQYICDNLTDELSLPEIASSVNLSPSYLAHLFKKVSGNSVMQYVTDLRLSRSVALLRATDLPITEISDNCGFSSLKTFSTAFKKKFACSPASFRRNTVI